MRKILQKMNVLLDGRQKRQMAVIVVMMLVGGVLESLGIGLIVPVMTVVLNPEKIGQSRILGALYQGLGMQNETQFAAFFMVLLIATFAVKNVFLFFQNVVQLRFIYTNQFATSRKMMINFMKRPYEYYLNADTTVIQRSITSDVNNMYGLILSCLQLVSEVIVFGCLVAILLMQDARMTLTIAALLVAVLVIVKIVIKPVMVKAGKDNQDYYSGLYKWIEESVIGIKEIRIAGKENYFINGYADCGAGYVGAVQKYQLFNSTPRLLIETVAIGGMVGYMLFVMWTGAKVSDMMNSLAVLAAAAARLLPSANRINNYLTSIAYFEPFFFHVSDNLLEDISDERVNYDEDWYRQAKLPERTPIGDRIEMRGITFHYPHSETLILEDASMVIPTGKSVGIVGTTGAGKTTIVDILLGLLTPQAGEILVNKKDVRDDYPGFLRNVGYIPQTIFLMDSSIRKNVAFGVPDKEIDDDKVWAALKEAQLDEFVRTLPEGLDTSVGERGIRLSGGQRQRISIARALFDDPQILVLDEATSALDNDTEAAIMESINRLHGRKTLIIIAHRLQTIEKCDMVYRVEGRKARLEKGEV